MTIEDIIALIFMGLVIILGMVMGGLFLYFATRRGEDCPGYPYNCPGCPNAAECIIEVGRKKDDA